MMACRLRQAGIEDFVILEKAARPGGTWRDNTYPGVGCDVPSHLYCCSTELNPDWSYRYAPGAEIQRYIEQIVEKHGLSSRIRFGYEVSSARWDDGRWHLSAPDGREIEADVVVSATGVLHHPAYPKIEGLDRFAGPVFHTARWRDDVVLEDHQVGVIGTGTTATQLVTAIAPRAGFLTVFQRTPSWILDVPNQRSPEWQKRLLRGMPRLYQWVNRLGTAMTAVTYGESFLGRSPLTRLYIEHRCRRALRQVRDAELRRKLTPAYVPGCKRLVFSSGYFQAIQRPNVSLVTAPIARIVPDGLFTTDGELHSLQVLILATGFQADAFMRPMAITGENGISIEKVWGGKPVAYRSVSIPHMPNFFLLVGPYSPIANVSAIEVAEWQIGYIMRCIDIVRRQNVCLAATETATADYVSALDRAAPQTVWASGCDSWYLGSDRLPSLYTRPPLRHRDELAEPPDLRDFEVRPLLPQATAL
jgi:cation diffusion facilitator CzcD-associated flavoprotein CzcO